MIARTVSRRKVMMVATPAAPLTIAMTTDIEIARLSETTEVAGIIRTTINMTTEEGLAAMIGKRETTETRTTIAATTATRIEEITMKGTIGTDITMIGDTVTKRTINTATAERTAKMIGGITRNTISREGEIMRDRLGKASSKNSRIMTDTRKEIASEMIVTARKETELQKRARDTTATERTSPSTSKTLSRTTREKATSGERITAEARSRKTPEQLTLGLKNDDASPILY